MSSMLSAVFTRRCCVQAYACLFVLLLLSLPCQIISKKKPMLGRIQRSQVDPHLRGNRCNQCKTRLAMWSMRVRLLVPFSLPVYSAGSKLTARRTWMSKSQGRTRELYSVLMRIRLDACLLYTSPSPRDGLLSRMPSSA